MLLSVKRSVRGFIIKKVYQAPKCLWFVLCVCICTCQFFFLQHTGTQPHTHTHTLFPWISEYSWLGEQLVSRSGEGHERIQRLDWSCMRRRLCLLAEGRLWWAKSLPLFHQTCLSSHLFESFISPPKRQRLELQRLQTKLQSALLLVFKHCLMCFRWHVDKEHSEDWHVVFLTYRRAPQFWHLGCAVDRQDARCQCSAVGMGEVSAAVKGGRSFVHAVHSDAGGQGGRRLSTKIVSF